ncbi:probable carboxylesterase 2 [Tanacetum coccineum]
MGEFVYRNNDASRAEDTWKLGPKWEGPYEVTEALEKGTYKLRDRELECQQPQKVLQVETSGSEVSQILGFPSISLGSVGGLKCYPYQARVSLWFVTESAASSNYQTTLNLITRESNVIIVSVNYRLAPEYRIPTAYEDSWEAIKWVATHARGNGPESWLNDHADLENIFFVGDSAGANIAHNMAIRAGLNSDGVINLKGVILLHPYFGGKDPIGEEAGKNKQFKAFTDQLWMLANPLGVGFDDPLYNPAMDTHISVFGCSKILLCVAENDKMKDRGMNYKKVMEMSGWKGRMEVFESKGEGHAFFLSNTTSENARILRDRICIFINPIRSKA